MKVDYDLINAVADKVIQVIKPELVGQIRHTTEYGPKGAEGGYYEMICPVCRAYLTIMDGELWKARKREGDKV